MPQESSPMWFGVAAGLHLGNFRAVQLGFSLLLVLPAASWNSSSGNLLPNEAADMQCSCTCGGLGFKDRHVTASPKCWQNTAEASPLTCEPQPTTCAAALHN